MLGNETIIIIKNINIQHVDKKTAQLNVKGLDMKTTLKVHCSKIHIWKIQTGTIPFRRCLAVQCF